MASSLVDGRRATRRPVLRNPRPDRPAD